MICNLLNINNKLKSVLARAFRVIRVLSKYILLT